MDLVYLSETKGESLNVSIALMLHAFAPMVKEQGLVYQLSMQ
jgi:hypothetical protein